MGLSPYLHTAEFTCRISFLSWHTGTSNSVGGQIFGGLVCVCAHIHSYVCTKKFGEDLVLMSTHTHTHTTLLHKHTHTRTHTHTHTQIHSHTLTHTHTTGLWDVGKTEPIKVGKASPTEGTLPGSIYFILKYQGMYLYIYIC